MLRASQISEAFLNNFSLPVILLPTYNHPETPFCFYLKLVKHAQTLPITFHWSSIPYLWSSVVLQCLPEFDQFLDPPEGLRGSWENHHLPFLFSFVFGWYKSTSSFFFCCFLWIVCKTCCISHHIHFSVINYLRMGFWTIMHREFSYDGL